MKKNLFVLALALGAGIFVAKAQIQRGNVLVGGDIANFDVGLNRGSVFNVNISPKAAWFIRDNTAVGAYLNLGYQTAKGQGSDFLYGIGALVRQYSGGNAVPAVRHTRLFVEANVGIDGINHSASSTNTTTNGLGLGIGPGLAYFITPNIGLEGLVMYRGILGFGTRATSSNLNLNVGFQIYLPGRAVRNAATNSQ
ncbi:hypothetical protein [Segetibacter sp.]|jgi:hypothetical protein|uniref:hypothetical protein n=1 Tax=Segetibacter sp. TaxID=2231182 RepID=UPI002630FE64|nr:hypothetical protein [Segetibacter sp.]MCW3080744.1 hypothetical protein [Segetibacter sp.]